MKSRKSRGYITKLGLWPTSRLNQRWESRVTAHLESQLGKGPRQHIRSAGETSQIAVQGFPLVIPGWTQTDIIINLWPNCKPVFLLMLSVLLYKTWNVVKPGLGWPGPLQGLNNLKISPHPIYGAASLALTAGSHSQSGQCPGRLEARSEACCALYLKPKPDYSFNFPNSG